MTAENFIAAALCALLGAISTWFCFVCWDEGDRKKAIACAVSAAILAAVILFLSAIR